MNVSLGPVGTTTGSGKCDLSYIKNWTPRSIAPSTNFLTSTHSGASECLTKAHPPTPVLSNNKQQSLSGNNAITDDMAHSSYASESVKCPTPVQHPRSNSNPTGNNLHEPFNSRKSLERVSPSSLSTGSSHGDHSPPARDPFHSLLNNRLTVNGDPYIKLEQIGSGGSSKVYRILGPDLKIYALKKIKLKRLDPASIEQYNNEIQLLKRLQGNPHIIRLIAAEPDLQQRLIHVVMEHGEIDLSEKLQKMKGSGGLEENFLRITWMQMLQAVHAIHSERIIHGDLKPANFLFVNGALKLIDFGIAKAISNDTTNIERESQVGTVNYMSPEAIQGNSGRRGGIHGKMKVGRASDIWSLGCILYQIVYGKPPFADLQNIIEKFRCIIDPSYQISFPPLKNKDLENVIRSCLQRDHRLRPTIEGPHGLLNHPFLKCSERIGNPTSSSIVTLNNAAQILDQVGEVLKKTGLSSLSRLDTSISMLQNEIHAAISDSFNSAGKNHLQRGFNTNNSSALGRSNRGPVL
jgi:serine/threonine protein kinase